MRLLYTVTGQFVDIDPATVEYAILSHTWSTNSPEQTYQEIRQIQEAHGLHTLTQSAFEGMPSLSGVEEASDDGRQSTSSSSHLITIWDDPAVSEKIKRACAVAQDAGYSLLWIDSCCIDKTSSAELSEAINSMYAWYRESSICYAYLADCPAPDDPDSWDTSVEFRESRWFKRGWTLQELIAPQIVVFLSNDWQFFGTKLELADLIATVTTIDPLVLTNKASLQAVSVATRMSWAAKRETTRIEDRAYSLLGLFGITMPTIYGEGEQAFFRLQDEILRRISDQSIFAWGTSKFEEIDNLTTSTCSLTPHPLLASSPDAFEALPISTVSHAEFAKRLGLDNLAYPIHAFTPRGLRFQFPLVSLADVFSKHSTAFERDITPDRCVLAILPCEPRNAPSALVAIMCSLSASHSLKRLSIYLDNKHVHRTVALSSDSLSACIRHLHIQTVDAPLESVHASQSPLRDQGKIDYASSRVSLELSKGSRSTLRAKGYSISLISRDPGKYCFILKKNERFGLEITFNFITRFRKLNVWVLPVHNSKIDTTAVRPSTLRGEYLLLVALESRDFVWECKLRDSAGQERLLRLSVLFPRIRYNAWTMDVTVTEEQRPASPSLRVPSTDSPQLSPPVAGVTQGRANGRQQTSSVVHAPLEPPRTSQLLDQSDHEPSTVWLELTKASCDTLERKGYMVSLVSRGAEKYLFVLNRPGKPAVREIPLGVEITFHNIARFEYLIIWVLPLHKSSIDAEKGKPLTLRGEYMMILPKYNDLVWNCRLRDDAGQKRSLCLKVLSHRSAWEIDVGIGEG